MRVEVSKIEAVERRELPKMQEVRTFLGLKMYYRRFVPDYSTMAAPLTDMIRKTQQNQDAEFHEGVCATDGCIRPRGGGSAEPASGGRRR